MKTYPHDSLDTIADAAASRLEKLGVKLTMGGEPSYVPVNPEGSEWNVGALGPTKLHYAYALASALLKKTLPNAFVMYSPGKQYPGEPNPRWALHMIWNRDGSRICPDTDADAASAKAKTKEPAGKKPASSAARTRRSLAGFRSAILKRLGLRNGWLRANDPHQPRSGVWVLPLDHDGTQWRTDQWLIAGQKEITLLGAEGPAGLRLPLSSLPPDATRRALVLESKADGVHLFLPPLLQEPFLELLKTLDAALRAEEIGPHFLSGYAPGDDANLWSKLSLTPDPGVIEINLPPCASAKEYGWWLAQLEECAEAAGLRSFKYTMPEEALGTGGGNHILLGGPSLDENPFFVHPQWVTSILRYWQHHPSLSYLFTGCYVGASSQAPRPDESSREHYDLEMAYRYLETLEPHRDHRYIISETLRHLHIDTSGNTHRSEISFDKFWNVAWAGGCRGLIEFRAVETLPRAEWMAAVGTLWAALAAYLFERKFTQPLLDHGDRLHDAFFLPTPLWLDFELILRDLRRGGYRFDQAIFRQIWDWRCPQMLAFTRGRARLTVRKALEGWPLLCETPLEGGNTSRFVDTSIDRLEFSVNEAFAKAHRVFVQGRELPFEKFPDGSLGAGLRYRRTSLYPSLHPGIAPHMPLFVTITDRNRRQLQTYSLGENRRLFEQYDGRGNEGNNSASDGNSGSNHNSAAVTLNENSCRKLHDELLTYDLRLA